MNYDEDQDLRQLLDDQARAYSPDRERIMALVDGGRYPSRRFDIGRAALAVAATVLVGAGSAWVLLASDRDGAVTTVGDESVTTEIAVTAPPTESEPELGDGTELGGGDNSSFSTTSSVDDDGAPSGEATPLTVGSASSTGPTTTGPTTTGPPTTGPTATEPPTSTTLPTTTSTAEPTTSTTEPEVDDVDPPDSCYVQTDGIEIFDSAFRFADSYAFFGAGGDFVLSTSSLGPPDDVEDEEQSIEWTARTYGYDHVEVYSVAAEGPEGGRSQPVVCRRHIDLD